jgi:hypothetical protein
MSAALAPTESDGSPVSDRAPEKASELRLDAFIRCIEYDPSRNDDNVDSGRRFVMTKHLSDETLCPVSDHGRPQFPRDADSDPSNVALSPIREDRHQTTRALRASLVDLFEIRALPNVLGRPKRPCHRSSDTVRRFRPFARRRFSTWRPSLVAMRTRKP